MARTHRPTRRLGSMADGGLEADVSERTIRRLVAAGKLTAYRVGPRLVKIDLDELAAVITPIPTDERSA